MDAATSNDDPTPPSGNVDAVDVSAHRGGDESLQLPDRSPASVVAKRRIREANLRGLPIRRSPRLSGLLPPQPPTECQDRQDIDGSGDDESESADDIAIHISREDTPENDCLPPDEPSTVLADRIIRAQGNPSPPPQDLAHPGVSYVSEKGDHLLPGISVPPSPFRPINLLERLNQLSFPPFELSHTLRTSTLDDGLDVSGSGINSPRGVISHESSSVPMKSIPHEDLTSVDTIPSSSAQCTVDDLPSSRHVCETANLVDNIGADLPSKNVVGLHGQPKTKTSSVVSEVFGSFSTHVIDPSSGVVSPTSDDRPQELLPSSKQQSFPGSSPLTPNAKTLSPPPSNESGQPPLAAEAAASCGQGNDREEVLFMDNNGLSILKEEQEGDCGTTNTKINANSQHRLDSLSPHSTNVLDGLCLPSESSIEQTVLPADSIHINSLSTTPPRTPGPSATHPDFSRTTVQRPVIAPTPVRVNNGARKLDSSVKFSLEIDDIYRTPARRVPIETALARGTLSFQRTTQLPRGSDQFQSGRFPMTRTPVFTRQALDDPSRSPAKRIPITGLAVSPTREHQGPSSPLRPSPRARGGSVDPHPLRPIPARSRSVEPGATISKPANCEKAKETLFPIAPVFPRSGTKLPFPLVPGHKPSSDPPPSIPEEPDTAEVGSIETNVTLHKVTQGNTMSQLRRPPANSRIPRVGNKPYARPLTQNGNSAGGKATRGTAGTPKAPPFQPPCKNNGVGNGDVEAPFTKPADDRRLVGSLKRKRGVEATTPSNSHPIMIRQVVPGILSEKYAPRPAKSSSQTQKLPESSPPKVVQPLKFRKVVDGMLSARYAPVKAAPVQTELLEATPLPPSPLSELSSSSNEGLDEMPPSTTNPSTCPKSEPPDASRTDGNTPAAGPTTYTHTSLRQDADGLSSRPRRTSRTRKPAQQQYVLDVFNGDSTSTRPPPARRKPQTRTEGDNFMGMSATALKALTASNTTKNQQTVAVLATEVIRKEGLRPESPTVKARTILQKQRDEREMRRKERAQRKTQLSEEASKFSDTEGQTGLGDRAALDARADHDNNDDATLQKHCRGPGDEEDYKTPERRERVIEPLRLEGVGRMVKPVKQVKWHRGLSTAVYLDEVDSRPKTLLKQVVVRGCLAPTSKNIPLDPLGNLVDIDNRPSPEFVMEQIVVKKYLYDNDIEPEPVPAKMTRSKSKKRS